MSTPASTDLILVERSGTCYKETKANWDTATGGGGGGGGGGSATNNLAIQFAFASMGGYSNAGSHFHDGGTLYYHRLDSSGAYTLSSTTTNNSSVRPNTKLKIGGTWYTINEGTTSQYTQTTGAGPFNVYYYRSMTSWTLTASEIETACGASSGTISGIAVKMDDAPSRTMPDHYIGVKLVSTGDASTNNSGTNNGSYTQVSYASSRNWVGETEGSYVEVTFSTNISWS